MLWRLRHGPAEGISRPHAPPGPKGACAVKLNVSLIKCGRCGKRYSNPLTHVCVTRMDRKPSARKTKVGPKLVVKCSCGAPLGNPLTHRCVTRTDFKKRAAEKPAPRPKPSGNAHEYAACEDDDCPRFQCRVYKEGRSDGRTEGWTAGYAIGFPEGMAACPLPHQG
jgi:hypothetical protein